MFEIPLGIDNTNSSTENIKNTHLSSSYDVFEGVQTKAEDIICMLQVETLRVPLAMVNNSGCGDVIHNFRRLQVEEIVATVVSPVSVNRWSHFHSTDNCFNYQHKLQFTTQTEKTIWHFSPLKVNRGYILVDSQSTINGDVHLNYWHSWLFSRYIPSKKL